jgi:hypothetical protein
MSACKDCEAVSICEEHFGDDMETVYGANWKELGTCRDFAPKVPGPTNPDLAARLEKAKSRA